MIFFLVFFDRFVDLFITLCIVINTVFMAMEHDSMGPTLSDTLKYGNYVCIIISSSIYVLNANLLSFSHHILNF